MSELRLGAEVKRLRQGAGLTQVELAARIGTSQKYVSKLESDDPGASAETVYRLAGALGVSCEHFGPFFGCDRPPGLPFYGKVPAGRPAEPAPDPLELINFRQLVDGPGRFVLRVKGRSMVEDGILDGDLVICRPADTAEPGEKVIATVNGANTLKRFARHGDQVVLMPRNRDEKPIPIVPGRDDARVVAVVVHVFRTV